MNVPKLEPSIGTDRLSVFERAVIERIGLDNAEIHEELSALSSRLRVTRQELTGVGAYIHFDCDDSIAKLGESHFGLSAPIIIPTLEYGLTTELACSNGKPTFLELCTTGVEVWNGDLTDYSFSDD